MKKQAKHGIAMANPKIYGASCPIRNEMDFFWALQMVFHDTTDINGHRVQLIKSNPRKNRTEQIQYIRFSIYFEGGIVGNNLYMFSLSCSMFLGKNSTCLMFHGANPRYSTLQKNKLLWLFVSLYHHLIRKRLSCTKLHIQWVSPHIP